jgi:RNA polymerase sigma-70 factor (ECF subfamily)
MEDSREKGDFDLPDTSMNPEKLIHETETEDRIMNAIDRLPEKLREIMILRHVEDMSYEKIADVTNCKIGTVKSRLARARETLRKMLDLLTNS